MLVRLNKFLSQTGISSRREADRMIAEGRVYVNGSVVQSMGYKIDEAKDIVEVDGRKVKKATRPIYLMLNKPPGYLVTRNDPFGRPTVMDLIPKKLGYLFPVGSPCDSIFTLHLS